VLSADLTDDPGSCECDNERQPKRRASQHISHVAFQCFELWRSLTGVELADCAAQYLRASRRGIHWPRRNNPSKRDGYLKNLFARFVNCSRKWIVLMVESGEQLKGSVGSRSRLADLFRGVVLHQPIGEHGYDGYSQMAAID